MDDKDSQGIGCAVQDALWGAAEREYISPKLFDWHILKGCCDEAHNIVLH